MQATQTAPTCSRCGLPVDMPPAIRALLELLGDETLCASCRTKEEPDGA